MEESKFSKSFIKSQEEVKEWIGEYIDNMTKFILDSYKNNNILGLISEEFGEEITLSPETIAKGKKRAEEGIQFELTTAMSLDAGKIVIIRTDAPKDENSSNG